MNATLTSKEITEAASGIYLSDFGGPGTQAYDIAIVRAALAALDKKAQQAAAQVPANMREFVEAVAGPSFTYIDRETDETRCSGCNCAEVYVAIGEPAKEVHTVDCIVLRARALLGGIKQ